MSNRRKLRPHETARRDQALAAGRDAAKDPHTAVLVVEDAEPGMRCSWCDCPSPLDDPASPRRKPGYRCGGCPEDAALVIRVWYGTPGQENTPVCEGHYRDVAVFFARAHSHPGTVIEFAEPCEDPAS